MLSWAMVMTDHLDRPETGMLPLLTAAYLCAGKLHESIGHTWDW
jgi:hypothetical protein